MTLTRILPTLRRSIPDPIAGDHWPAATVATITDVTVDGVSLLRVVELCGTPAVHLGPAAVAGTGGGLASAAKHSGVVVVRVLETSARPDDRERDGERDAERGAERGAERAGGRTASIDADLAELDPVWAEARLIGRTSVARATPTTLTGGTSGCSSPAPVALPGDLAAGDLLALPFAAVTDDAGVARKRGHDAREGALA